MKIGVVGGGAAGIFSAIRAKEKLPECEVIVFEKSHKILSKVKISGGGRCNVTNNTPETENLVMNYPRGNKELVQVFSRFGVNDTIHWFEGRGVQLKTENDNRVFPVTDKADTIIDCLKSGLIKNNITVKYNHSIKSITKKDDVFILRFNSDTCLVDKVIIAAGGFHRKDSYDFIESLGHKIIQPVPSLFTFASVEKKFEGLEGISVNDAEIKIRKAKFRGTILFTHWGFSGPVILKISAYLAYELGKLDYKFDLIINFLPGQNIEETKNRFQENIKSNPEKLINNVSFPGIPLRLWKNLVGESGISKEKKWSAISKAEINKLSETIHNNKNRINGKSTNKEEFVTAGGVDLKEIDFKSMESKVVNGLFFAGEVLNIDGITGGFNFQSAWSTGWLAGSNIFK
jgi:predicted Rossmann fold flavoprotein